MRIKLFVSILMEYPPQRDRVETFLKDRHSVLRSVADNLRRFEPIFRADHFAAPLAADRKRGWAVGAARESGICRSSRSAGAGFAMDNADPVDWTIREDRHRAAVRHVWTTD